MPVSCVVGFAVIGQRGFSPGIAVEQVNMLADVEQREMLGLPVDINQVTRRFRAPGSG